MKFAKSLIAALLVILLAVTMSVSSYAAYNDVGDDSESLKAIEFVDKLGIIPAAWNGDFYPEQFFTRGDAVKAAYRTLYGKEIDTALYEEGALVLEFSTGDEEGEIRDDSILKYYLAWAVDNQLVTTKIDNSMFYPAEPITANELLTMLAKILCLVEDPEGVQPDTYAEAAAFLSDSVELGDGKITREQAAVLFANAIVSYDGELGEIGVYEDFDGNPLNSLAVKVFNMSSIDLVVRATKNRNLGYNVKNGTLLSCGADVDLGEDLSEYVGYGINVTYRDTDSSKTYTEDEEILAYSVSSTKTMNATGENLFITSGSTIAISGGDAQLNFGTATYYYLNDDPWPIGDPQYDLVKLVPAIGKVTSIDNRPSLAFKCMQAKETDTVLATVFATEARPGKIVGINKGIYTVYDYYNAGSDSAYRNFDVNNCKFSTTVKVGDYVSFYESNGICYFNPGTAVISAFSSKDVDPTTGGSEYILTDDTILKEQAFFKYGDTLLTANGSMYSFILDTSGTNHLVTWELYKTNHAQLVIKTIDKNTAAQKYAITATDIITKKDVSFEVTFENTESPVAVVAGDFINYSDNGNENARVVYIKKTPSKTLNVKDMGDYFLDLDTEKIYYKNKYYLGNVGTGGEFESGTCTLNLDMANCVVSINY